MRFKRIVMVLILGMIFAVFALPPVVHSAEAFRVWGCTESGCGGSWCNNLPGCSNCYNWHNVCGWYGWYDSYDCNVNFIGRYGGISNKLTCVTHGGPYGGCCSVMGTGIFPHDCFAYGDTGCGPIDYGSIGCGEVEDLRTDPMKNGQCCPQGLCDDYKNLGLLPNVDDKINVACETNSTTGNPVSVATGNKYEEVLDMSLSTPGIPLEFRRSYNSQLILDGPLGYGWTHNLNVSLEVVKESPSERVRVKDSDGRFLYFTESGGIYTGESGVIDKLQQVNPPSGDFILRRKEGNLTYAFEYETGSKWRLAEISDPNGNTLTFDYTTPNQLTVSNNFGKALLIHYNGNRIDYIQDPKGQSVAYEYTVSGDLRKVNYRDKVPPDPPVVKDFIEYSYDANHNLIEKKDTDGTVFGHWEYDNRQVTEYYSHMDDQNPPEKQERITFDYSVGETKVTRTTETGDYLTTYFTKVINGIHVVEKIEGCSTCGSVEKEFAYIPGRLELSQITSIDNGIRYTTQYAYDDPNRPWEITGITEALTNPPSPEERTTTYYYDHRLDDPFILNYSTETRPSVVAGCPQSKVITTNYDTKGKILSRVETGCVLINGNPTQNTYTTIYEYDNGLPSGPGLLTKINGPRTDINITNFEYYENTVPEVNNRYQLKAIVNALLQRTEFSMYDANGNVGQIKDPNNVETQYTYDERNRVKTITNLSTTAQTQYFYDARGNLAYIILPELNQIYFAYNLANKLTEIRDQLGNKIIYGYDAEGNRNREERKDPQGILKKYLDFTYDSYNRLKKIINPDTKYSEYTYDGRGNTKTIKDPRGSITTFNYDPLSRIKDMTQPGTVMTDYGYDTQDNLTSVIDPNDHSTTYVYDDFGRKNKTESPDTGITKYEYDEAGNLIKRVDAMGTVVNYYYDALNRLTNIDFSGTGEDIAFTYDSGLPEDYGKGRLTERSDPSGNYTFHYYPDGKLKKEVKTITGGGSYTTQYEYNKNGVLTKITYPTGRIINYDPDSVDRTRISQVRINDSPTLLASGINYLPFGGVAGLTYGNNLTLTQEYDTQYRVSSIVTGSIIDLTYEYDANGNVKSITDAINPSVGQGLEASETYTYGQGTNNRLTQISGAALTTFEYDDNGNIRLENTSPHL